jgi:hypothetical protein
VAEGVSLVAAVDGLDDHDLEGGRMSASLVRRTVECERCMGMPSVPPLV